MGDSTSNKAEEMFCKLLVHNKLSDAPTLGKVLKDRSGWSQPTLPEEVVSRGIIKEAHAEKVRGAVEAKGLNFPLNLEDDAPTLSVEAPEDLPMDPPSASAPPAPIATSSPIPEGSNLIPNLPCQPTGPGRQLIELLQKAREMGGSDLHISVGAPALIRIRGKLETLQTSSFDADQTEAMLFDVLLEGQKSRCREDLQIDFSLVTIDGRRFRSNIVKERTGWVGCFRIVPEHIPTLTELGLPNQVKTLTEYPTGLVLVTGPMGCGKTTTLAAMVNLINENRKDHIITVEDPVEFRHHSKNCQVTQRSLGAHTVSFANALKGALRQDPDVIMIGELRDLETISIAITAAETGHLVLGSLHTNSAERTIDRIVSSFPPDQQAQIRVMAADSIRGIICQQLIPRADGQGSAMALEILVNNTSVRKMIVDNRTFQLESVLQTGKKQGMIRMDDSVLDLLQQGVITEETARIYLRNPNALN